MRQPSFRIKPVESLSVGLVHLSSTYSMGRYIFPNEEGTFADEGINYYLSSVGQGSFSNFLDFNFDIRLNNIEGFHFKKGSIYLRSQSVSVEIGRNTIWLGQSYHGSLLLSTNAEPYALIRFRTERPFRIPYVGHFDYTLFHGWPRRFNIIGHQLSWYPVSWLEFNVKQTIVYSERYSLAEYLLMFTGKEANLNSKIGRTDTRASFEIIATLGFIPRVVPPVSGAIFYIEYGGEDLYAKWQDPDAKLRKDLWVGPFGFELLDTGILTGLRMKSHRIEVVLEYAQNYKSHYLFYDPYNGTRKYNVSWYRGSAQPQFLNNGALMGHHMGSAAEMISFHYTQMLSDFSIAFLLSRRHRWYIGQDFNDVFYKVGAPERQDVLSGRITYITSPYSLILQATYNRYKNVDQNTNPVINRPTVGVKAAEYLLGLTLKVNL